jgi:hypothetical protein
MDGSGSDTHGNGFIGWMGVDRIRMEMDSDILDIYFSISFYFLSLLGTTALTNCFHGRRTGLVV